MTYDPIRNAYGVVTFGDLIDDGYRLAGYCNGCGRSEWLDIGTGGGVAAGCATIRHAVVHDGSTGIGDIMLNNGLLVSCFLVFTFLAAAGARASDTPKRDFDRAFAWLQQNRMVNGYIVSDTPSKLHHFSSELVAAPASLASAKIAYAGLQPFEDYPIFTSADGETLTLREKGKMVSVDRGERIPGIDHYLYMGVQNGKATASLTFLYSNVDAANALMRMYDATGKQDYLNNAGTILRQAYARVSPDGRYYLHFAGYPKTYMGMPQGILMRALDRYFRRSGRYWADQAIVKMAMAYANTTEGTWDHWTNSMMGFVIARKYGIRPRDVSPTYLDSMLAEFLAQIKSQNGSVPQIMNKKDKRWPHHYPSYQSYHLLTLLELARVSPHTRQGICAAMPSIFAATIPQSGITYRARKATGAALMHGICHIDKRAFVEKAFNELPSAPPASVNAAIGQMMIAAAVETLR